MRIIRTNNRVREVWSQLPRGEDSLKTGVLQKIGADLRNRTTHQLDVVDIASPSATQIQIKSARRVGRTSCCRVNPFDGRRRVTRRADSSASAQPGLNC